MDSTSSDVPKESEPPFFLGFGRSRLHGFSSTFSFFVSTIGVVVGAVAGVVELVDPKLHPPPLVSYVNYVVRFRCVI